MKRKTKKTVVKLIIELILFLSRKELLEEFENEIKEAFEYGFFKGVCQGILDLQTKRVGIK